MKNKLIMEEKRGKRFNANLLHYASLAREARKHKRAGKTCFLMKFIEIN